MVTTHDNISLPHSKLDKPSPHLSLHCHHFTPPVYPNHLHSRPYSMTAHLLQPSHPSPHAISLHLSFSIHMRGPPVTYPNLVMVSFSSSWRQRNDMARQHPEGVVIDRAKDREALWWFDWHARLPRHQCLLVVWETKNDSSYGCWGSLTMRGKRQESKKTKVF